jgi:hypothetical protein
MLILTFSFNSASLSGRLGRVGGGTVAAFEEDESDIVKLLD